MSFAAIFPPTMQTLENWIGERIPSRAIHRSRENPLPCSAPRRHGKANGGKQAAAERSGKASPPIPILDSCMSEPETDLPGTTTFVARETVFTLPPSLLCG